ncbi:MAG: efflux RND transporter periplasmic adaptor subunit [Pseudomonadota bacterium]
MMRDTETEKSPTQNSAASDRAHDQARDEATPAQPSQTKKSGWSSYALAAVIALAIAAWMATGDLPEGYELPFNTASSETAAPDSAQTGATAPAAGAANETSIAETAARPMRVQVIRVMPQERRAELTIRGETRSPARVQVRAETAGVVESIAVEKGALVNPGDLLCTIEVGTRDATLTEARASRTKAQADFTSSSRLASKGFTAESRRRADKAALDSARAAFARAEIDLKRTKVRAPITGIVEQQPVKKGDYLRQADVCATVVKLDPILLAGAVAERDVARLRKGMPVRGKLVTGETVDGKLTFVSPAADTTTRTFMFEAEVTNADRKLRAGVTTDIIIPLEAQSAHKVMASALILDDAGRLGLRTLDAADTAQFTAVDIISNDTDAVWIEGLEGEARVITVGQEFVSNGQKVEPVEVNQEARSDAQEPTAPTAAKATSAADAARADARDRAPVVRQADKQDNQQVTGPAVPVRAPRG